MVTLADIDAIIETLPGVSVGETYGNKAWKVGKATFVWDRAMSKADVKRFAPNQPPPGPTIALFTGDLIERDAILADNKPGFFTIEHFNGYPAYLISLPNAKKRDVRDAVLDAWLAVAPQQLAEEFLANKKKRSRA